MQPRLLLRSVLEGSIASGADTDPLTLPPLPEAPIFDAPSNPFIAGVLSGSGLPMFEGLTPERVRQTQIGIINTIVASAKESAVKLTLTLMVAWLLMLLVSGLLLFRVRRNRQAALRGDVEAAKRIVLPAFEPLLWLMCGVNTLYLVVYGLMLASDRYLIYVSKVSIEVMYAGKQFNFMLVPIFMLQKSLSGRALIRCVVQTLLLSLYTVPIVWIMCTFGSRAHARIYYWTLVASRCLAIFFFVYLFVFPPARASVWTFREFCGYVITMFLLMFAAAETFRQNHADVARALGWVITVYSMFVPIFVWRVLRADTEHWRGIGKRAVELQAVFRRKNGRVDERVSSQGLHVLIEMHRKFIIDFAHLQLREQISESSTDRSISTNGNSAGANASDMETSVAVYCGFLHTKKVPVAIKIYMPSEFTEETVAAFSHEAALCGSLVHPNVLKFYGMCVCPPNICMVTELCQGSLKDVTETRARLRQQLLQHYSDGACAPLRKQQQFLINIAYMLDAARAVAYLHSFSPPFVHRDIKPSNFLVDNEGTVKLTDFGASRTLVARSLSGHQHQQDDAIKDRNAHCVDEVKQTSSTPAPARILEVPGVVSSMIKHTPQYMAPEVIKAQHAATAIYGEAADVYALAMTMWDVLYPGTPKYPLAVSSAHSTASHRSRGNDNNHNSAFRETEIFDRVFAGERPFLDPHLYPGLRELLERAWHADARQRPTAQAVVSSLEAIQEETCAVFALELMEELSERGRHPATSVTAGTIAKPPSHSRPGIHRQTSMSTGQLPHSSFAGTQAVEKLRICDFVQTQGEAIRMGNMLMDAGFLHHVKHARSFEYSGSQYFFDEDQILLCQPMVVMEDSQESEDNQHLAESSRRGGGGYPQSDHRQSSHQLQRQKLRHDQRSAGSSYQEHGHGHGSHALLEQQRRRCACRKLGRRMETERTTRRRLRYKFKAFTNENMLTARLLADDHPSNASDFAAFNESSDGTRGSALKTRGGPGLAA